MTTSEAKFQRWFGRGLKLYTELYFVPEDSRRLMARVFAKEAIAREQVNEVELAKELFDYQLAEVVLEEIDSDLRESKILVVDKKTSVFFRGKAITGYVAIKRSLYALYRDSSGDVAFKEKWDFAKRFWLFVFLWAHVQRAFLEGIGLGPRIEDAIADHGENIVTDVYNFFQYFLERSPEVEVAGVGLSGRLPPSEIASILEDYAEFIKEAIDISPITEPSSTQETPSNTFTRSENAETWTVTFQGKSASFKDSQGLRYLAHLLDSPGDELTPKMLVTLATEKTDLADEYTRDAAHQAGITDKDVDQGIPRFEPEELKRLRLDLEELKSNHSEAIKRGDVGEAGKIDREKQELEQYINKGTNIRGRPRQIASEAEKQRISVYNAIKYQLRKFKEDIPPLNTHLDNQKNLKTGSVLAYKPYPNVFWTVSF